MSSTEIGMSYRTAGSFRLLDVPTQPTEAIQPHERNLRNAAASLGETILDASDVADVGYRIEAAIIAPGFSDTLASLAAAVDFATLERLATSNQPIIADSRVRDLFGDGAIRRINEGLRDEVAVIAATLNLGLVHAARVERNAQESTSAYPSHLSFIVQEVPVTMWHAVVELARAQTAILTVLHALWTNRSPRLEVAAEIADTYARGMRAYLRLLASDPSSGVPLDIVPQADRHNVEAIQSAHQASWVDLEAKLARGETMTGPPVDDD